MLGDPLAQRRERPWQAHRAAQRQNFERIELEQLAHAKREILARENRTALLSPAPGIEQSIRKVKPHLDPPQPQRLDLVVRDVDPHGKARYAREKFTIGLARRSEELPRRLLRRRDARAGRNGGATDHAGVLANLLFDVLGEEGLECGQGKAQRQRGTRALGGAPAELAQQPAVQLGECLLAIQARGLTALWNPSMPAKTVR